jgi:hypothetical protein
MREENDASARAQEPAAGLDRSLDGGLPDFLVIGGQKCGTTWLAAMLDQHPQVCSAPEKEVHFFNKEAAYGRGLGWYREHFSRCRERQVIGEYTPNYLWITVAGEPESEGRTQDIPGLVAHHLPDVRLIVVLRDPVRRAISAYYHAIRRGRVSPWSSIADAGARHGILSMGLYYQHLKSWHRSFDRERFLVLIFEEDVLATPAATMRRVYSFVGVDPSFEPAGLTTPRNQKPSDIGVLLSHYLSRKLARRFDRRFPGAGGLPIPGLRVTDSETSWLRSFYEADSRNLQELLSRELPWSTVAPATIARECDV